AHPYPASLVPGGAPARPPGTHGCVSMPGARALHASRRLALLGRRAPARSPCPGAARASALLAVAQDVVSFRGYGRHLAGGLAGHCLTPGRVARGCAGDRAGPSGCPGLAALVVVAARLAQQGSRLVGASIPLYRDERPALAQLLLVPAGVLPGHAHPTERPG